MAKINEAYAVLTDMASRQEYDTARKNDIGPSSEVVVNKTEDGEAEPINQLAQQEKSSAIAPINGRIPKFLLRSFVVSVLLVIVGVMTSSVVTNKGGDIATGFGLIGLALFTFPSFVWWVARGGIKNLLEPELVINRKNCSLEMMALKASIASKKRYSHLLPVMRGFPYIPQWL